MMFRVGHLLLAASMCSLLTAIGGGPVRTGNGNPEITETGDFWLRPDGDRVGFRFRKEQNCGIKMVLPAQDGSNVVVDGTYHLADQNKYTFADHSTAFNADGWTDYEMDTTGKIVHGTDEWPLKPLAVTDNGVHVNVTVLTPSCAIEIVKGRIVAVSSNGGIRWPIWAIVLCVIGGILLVLLIVAVVVWIVVRRRRRQSKLRQNEAALNMERKKTRLSETVTPTPPPPPPAKPPSMPAPSVATVDVPPPTPNLPPSSAVPTTETTAPPPLTSTEPTPPAPTNVTPAAPQKTTSKNAAPTDDGCCDRLADAAAGTPATAKCERTPSVEAKKSEEHGPARRSRKRSSASKGKHKKKDGNATLATVPPSDAPTDLPSTEVPAPAVDAPPPPRLRKRTASEDDKANPALIAFDETEERDQPRPDQK